MKSEKPSTIELLTIKKAKFRESIKQQIILLGELRVLCVKLQQYERAASYKDVEQDFQDVMHYLKETNL